jgi:RHS repeat-associated protein
MQPVATTSDRLGGSLLAPELTQASYNRARYYDPSVGRFLSEDPTGFNAGINFYAYVSNNATNLIDPKGLLQICCRNANLGSGVVAWATLNLVPPPCHCFLKLSDGSTYGGYHQSSKGGIWGDLVLRYGDSSDNQFIHPNSGTLCNDVPGKPCENDARAQNAFHSLPGTLGGYGFGGSAVGTSNDAARLILKQAGLDSTLPACAWGKRGGALPTFIPSVLLPVIVPGFPRPKPVV